MVLRKILVANRGEIACRVMRTARAMGLRTVAVYSDADREAPHVRAADEALRIGAAPPAASYLNIAALIDAARASGADAVHPGYGFLSERADFARACSAAGLVFIGPGAEAIEAMGDKALAKSRMRAAGVPCVPGYLGEDQAESRFADEAARIGFPLLVKAVAGGGGRGMRLVRVADELPAALAGARREAEAAFGDGRLMLERWVEHGRHIEIQVFGDMHGQVIHLGERDCSTQRRRQKLIEEAPAPGLAPALREALGRDAVAAALAVGYVGAGTVEFIVDAQGRHCFLEMNTRLQVEHPVTECVTGFDLVEWQLRVAAGEPLPATQAQVRADGHAIELRLVAEDTYDGFAPQTGTVCLWQPQAARQAGARIDAGIDSGSRITPHYDALLAKLIVHGRDRRDAIRRAAAALDDLPLLGLGHNARLLRDLLRHEDFVAARLDTATLDRWSDEGAALLQRPPVPDLAWSLAAASRVLRDGPGWRPAGLAGFDLTLHCEGETRTLRVQLQPDGISLHDGAHTQGLRVLAREGAAWRIEVDGVARSVWAVEDGATLWLWHDARSLAFSEPSPNPQLARAADPRHLQASVAGVVSQVLVKEGDQVAAGQPLLCIEAMKMEMWLSAAAAGTVRALHARPRDSVEAGARLVELEPDAASETH